MNKTMLRKAELRRAELDRQRKVLNKGSFKKTVAEGESFLRAAIEDLGIILGPQAFDAESLEGMHSWSIEDLADKLASMRLGYHWLIADYEQLTAAKGAFLTTYSPVASDAITIDMDINWKDITFSITLAAAIPQDDIDMLTRIGVRRVNTRNSTSSHQETTYVCEV